MKRITSLSIILVASLALLSFNCSIESVLTGTYGVSENDPSQIELQLNEDHSFHYQDYSNLKMKVDIEGHWTIKNNHVLLNADHSEIEFHSKWKIDNEGQIAKSRKGLTFYSLMKR